MERRARSRECVPRAVTVARVARHTGPRSQGDRRSRLIVLGAVVLVVGVVGVRAAASMRQLRAAAATTAEPRRAADPTRAPSARSVHRKLHSQQHRATPTRAHRSAPTLAGLPRRLDAQLGSRDNVSVAAVELTSGRRFDYGATSGMIDASVSKLDVLEALLLHDQQAHTPLTTEDDALATAMIEHSDNGAGQTLWDGLGYAPAIDAMNVRLGLRHTAPDAAGYYGLTTSCADDQLALLDDLVNRHGPLTAQSRRYARTLLGNVEPDQRWGVSAAADPDTSVEVKNGWLPIDDDAGRWVVNSDGIVTVAGHRVLLAVMTRHNVDEQDGIALVETISREVAAALA